MSQKGRKQVENLKYNSCLQKSKDELYDLVEKSKAESKTYIRKMQLTPAPACVLTTDQQIKDVKRFCTSNTQTTSVFCVDITFNIGHFMSRPPHASTCCSLMQSLAVIPQCSILVCSTQGKNRIQSISWHHWCH